MKTILLLALILSTRLQNPGQVDPATLRLQIRQATELITVFGDQLEHVSLLAPTDVVERQLMEFYGPYVSDRLLAAWTADPREAPGRITSSPWPVGIEVLEVTLEDEEEFLVHGQIEFVTSVELTAGEGKAATTLPVLIRVEREQGPWQITEFRAATGGDTTEGVTEPWKAVTTDRSTVHYPAAFDVSVSSSGLPPSSVPPCAHGFALCVYYAGDDYRETNLISAGVAVRWLDLPEQRCESVAGNYAVVENVRRESLGEDEYLVFETSEAAMNKAASDVVYRRWSARSCLELVTRIATTNVGVYEPGAVAELGADQLSTLRQLLRRIAATLEGNSID
ncbi:MAG TPA: hypothetical protein VF168_08580 [Trueperaceae bacterium]